MMSSFALSAQNLTPVENDTLVKAVPVKPFIRIGVDVSAIGRQLVEKEVQQFEISLDSEVIRNWLATTEFGFLKVDSEEPLFSYSAQGYFFRAGMDYNLLNRPSSSHNDLVQLGVRYAYGYLEQEAPFYYITDPYWGDHMGAVGANSFHMHWLEFAGGVKVEVFRNIFVAWSLRTRVRLSETKDPLLTPYYISGFGHGKRNAPIMVHYSVLYRLGF